MVVHLFSQFTKTVSGLNAVRRQNIDIKEIDKDVLGSENEKTAPR